MNLAHRPVLLAEAVSALNPRDGGLYVDGTLGAGGHAEAVLKASAPGGRLLGLDRDPLALELAAKRLSPHGSRAELVLAAFDRIEDELAARGENGADGVLLDLGVSSMQLDRPDRGFSFRHDAPLDMRMGSEGPTAADLLQRLSLDDMSRLFSQKGGEPFSRRIAKALVKARGNAPIETTAQLASLVEQALPAAERRRRKLHPATRVFMALRMEVNDELGHLERFLSRTPAMLKPGGRLAVISYHSLEDRRVKKSFRAFANPCTCPPRLGACVCGRRPLFSLPGGKAVKPGPREIAENPRSRSARLRWAERTEEPASWL